MEQPRQHQLDQAKKNPLAKTQDKPNLSATKAARPSDASLLYLLKNKGWHGHHTVVSTLTRKAHIHADLRLLPAWTRCLLSQHTVPAHDSSKAKLATTPRSSQSLHRFTQPTDSQASLKHKVSATFTRWDTSLMEDIQVWEPLHMSWIHTFHGPCSSQNPSDTLEDHVDSSYH